MWVWDQHNAVERRKEETEPPFQYNRMGEERMADVWVLPHLDRELHSGQAQVGQQFTGDVRGRGLRQGQVTGGTYQYAEGRGFQGQDHVAAYTPGAKAEELLFHPSATLGGWGTGALFCHSSLFLRPLGRVGGPGNGGRAPTWPVTGEVSSRFTNSRTPHANPPAPLLPP